MKKKIYIIVSVVAALLILGTIVLIINKKDNKENIKQEEKEEVKQEEKPRLKIIDEDSNSRTIAVMINNHNQARPYQTGLSEAYIIYEALVEGGITRMMALFKDKNIEKIGPVRSARPYYIDYVMENDAIYVHFGHSRQAVDDLAKYKINNINGLVDSAFWRDNTLNVAYEHRAFTNTENINKLISAKGYRTTTDKKAVLNYSVDEINLDSKEESINASKVDFTYSYYMKVGYVYDLENKVYNRFANGVAHSDGVTGIQYNFKNIIILNVANSILDSEGHVKLDNVGSGSGYYITNGSAVEINWSKESRDAKTIYTYKDGSELKVNDGNTFIQIVPIDTVPLFE